eukprot:6202310-Pleurochrysis_carterae.AAC.1
MSSRKGTAYPSKDAIKAQLQSYFISLLPPRLYSWISGSPVVCLGVHLDIQTRGMSTCPLSINVAKLNVTCSRTGSRKLLKVSRRGTAPDLRLGMTHHAADEHDANS